MRNYDVQWNSPICRLLSQPLALNICSILKTQRRVEEESVRVSLISRKRHRTSSTLTSNSLWFWIRKSCIPHMPWWWQWCCWLLQWWYNVFLRTGWNTGRQKHSIRTQYSIRRQSENAGFGCQGWISIWFNNPFSTMKHIEYTFLPVQVRQKILIFGRLRQMQISQMSV